MVLAIVLSLAAGFCTATSPVCQRLGARSLDVREPGVTGFDRMLVSHLAQRRPDQLASCGGGVGHATPGPFTNGIDEEVAAIGGGG